MGKIKLTNDDKADIIKLINQGKHKHAIAKQYGVTPQCIYNIARNENMVSKALVKTRIEQTLHDSCMAVTKNHTDFLADCLARVDRIFDQVLRIFEENPHILAECDAIQLTTVLKNLNDIFYKNTSVQENTTHNNVVILPTIETHNNDEDKTKVVFVND